MARKCTICDHPQLTEIDDALRNNATLDEIAQRFAISRDAAGRHHRKGHVPPIPPEVEADPRVQEAKEAATTAVVERYEDVPKVLERIRDRWEMLGRKYDEMLREAETGPDFNDDVIEAIEAMTNGNKAEAAKLLIDIRELLAGDRADRRATMKEMRLLAADQAKVWRDYLEQNKKPEPIPVTYQVIRGPDVGRNGDN